MSNAESLATGEVFPETKDLDIHRTGMVFLTPLSTESYHNGPGVKKFVEAYYKMMEGVMCKRFTNAFLYLKESLPTLRQASIYLPTSHPYVYVSLLHHNCNQVFCSQLSDQLAFCQECQARPVVHLITKNEAAMQQHLENHKRETDEQKGLYKHLMLILS